MIEMWQFLCQSSPDGSYVWASSLLFQALPSIVDAWKQVFCGRVLASLTGADDEPTGARRGTVVHMNMALHGL